ncbi:holo-ACP synthase [Bradyrhizobium sp. JYMT SZCCT0428]|uniref:holo-ACP synthase n=1 Tax=Bradyrhizobium sp. JYMT SZCCT0428 TaxID=2807673 RepID=UPI001BA52EF0|nr:4'-phosphopantetheinyl transferase superfamily protein [Bradyrhizobium sp. JYMT SZCCT0428]MBR1156227.1 4'-phosphopantetheinyl transferase superfamily protein [Bradyrhizobium sp. JYMT SZCCT0428]
MSVGVGDDWIDEVFTADERKLCERGIDPTLLLARGFSGKEACLKALGTGRTADIDWHDIEVLQTDPSASLRLSGGALQELQGLTPASYEPVLHACFGCRDRASHRHDFGGPAAVTIAPVRSETADR